LKNKVLYVNETLVTDGRQDFSDEWTNDMVLLSKGKKGRLKIVSREPEVIILTKREKIIAFLDSIVKRDHDINKYLTFPKTERDKMLLQSQIPKWKKYII
jgi:hypothetical protein